MFAFLKLAGVPFTHQHIFDASAAPRGQLPYIVDDGEAIGDSDTIIAHLIRKYRLTIDDGLTAAQRDTNLWSRACSTISIGSCPIHAGRTSGSGRPSATRCSGEHPSLTEAGLRKAQEFNSQRYHYQGIGRFAPAAAYARGIADLRVLANLIPASGYLHGPKPTSIDAGIYGFIANIYFYRDRNAAQAVRRGASQSCPALLRHPRRYRFDRASEPRRRPARSHREDLNKRGGGEDVGCGAGG